MTKQTTRCGRSPVTESDCTDSTQEVNAAGYVITTHWISESGTDANLAWITASSWYWAAAKIEALGDPSKYYTIHTLA